MKPCGKPIGNFSRHAPLKVDRIRQMKAEVEENCMRATIFRIHGLLAEIYDYNGVTEWLLTPREGLEYRTPWKAIEDGEHEKVLTIVENLAKILSPL